MNLIEQGKAVLEAVDKNGRIKPSKLGHIAHGVGTAAGAGWGAAMGGMMGGVVKGTKALANSDDTGNGIGKGALIGSLAAGTAAYKLIKASRDAHRRNRQLARDVATIARDKAQGKTPA
jgi:hypothetical protein